MISLADVRLAVQKALGSAFSDRLWDYMVQYRHVADMDMTEDEVTYAIAVARDLALLAVEPRAARANRPRRANADECRRSISALLAADAAARDDVVALRGRIGPLQPWDHIEVWLDAQVRRERRQLASGPPWVELAYSMPMGGSVRRRRVRVGGLLADLSDVGFSLEENYGWQVAQAVVWVLTGIPPGYERMYADRVTHSSGLAATDRIVLSIDPAAPAADVAAFYRRARGGTSRRTISARQARLAAFVAERPKEPWRRRMDVWNALHPSPGWRYDYTSNMIRDAAVARDRLLRPRDCQASRLAGSGSI